MTVDAVVLAAIREAGWELDALITHMEVDVPPVVVYQAHKIAHETAGETVPEWGDWVRLIAARADNAGWLRRHGIEVVS